MLEGIRVLRMVECGRIGLVRCWHVIATVYQLSDGTLAPWQNVAVRAREVSNFYIHNAATSPGSGINETPHNSVACGTTFGVGSVSFIPRDRVESRKILSSSRVLVDVFPHTRTVLAPLVGEVCCFVQRLISGLAYTTEVNSHAH